MPLIFVQRLDLSRIAKLIKFFTMQNELDWTIMCKGMPYIMRNWVVLILDASKRREFFDILFDSDVKKRGKKNNESHNNGL